MSLNIWSLGSASVVGVFACGMAGALFFRSHRNPFRRSLGILFSIVAIACLSNVLELLNESQVLLWHRVFVVAELAQSVGLLYVGQTLFLPVENKGVRLRWIQLIGGIGVGMAAVVVAGQAFQLRAAHGGQEVMALTIWGRLTYVFVVIVAAFGVAQLELALRASQEPVRHKLKFIILGLMGLAGYQVYQASQLLLLSVWPVEHVVVRSLVVAVVLCLVAYGFSRIRLRDIYLNTYVSQRALLGSVTFLVIGLYLLMVGAIGEWLRETNQSWGEALRIILAFVALVGLAVAAFSKTVRADIQRVIARNFYRSKFDYRAQWLRVTEAFESASSTESIMNCLLDLLINTFPTTSVSIWSFREADRRYCRIRSMNDETAYVPIELSHPVIAQLQKEDEPVFIENSAVKPKDGDSVADSLTMDGVTLCFPIQIQGQLLAFIALGPPLRGERYGTDDCDLLRGISHHVGVLIAHARLAEERQAAAELEALHRFTVFCLHDLKNLAARLSLVAQNAEDHGHDPAFIKSAMRTVTDTSGKMAALMSKLSAKAFKSDLVSGKELIDLGAIIEEVATMLQGESAVRLHIERQSTHLVRAVKEQLYQVVLNVVLNATQSIAHTGDVRVGIVEINGSVVVTVEDTGCGISPSRLETIFRPSQSTRPGGLGIGLYQCKQIVEAHGGTIEIRSEEGKGTQLKITLPTASISEAQVSDSRAYSTAG